MSISWKIGQYINEREEENIKKENQAQKKKKKELRRMKFSSCRKARAIVQNHDDPYRERSYKSTKLRRKQDRLVTLNRFLPSSGVAYHIL